MGYEGKSQLAEMRSSLGLESRVVSKLRGRETELGFGTQVETPGSLLLSRVGSQHRGLVRATAHSGTLPGFCPAQNSIRWGGVERRYWWVGGPGSILSLQRVLSFQTTHFWSLIILPYFYCSEGWGWGLRFLLSFWGAWAWKVRN